VHHCRHKLTQARAMAADWSPGNHLSGAQVPGRMQTKKGPDTLFLRLDGQEEPPPGPNERRQSRFLLNCTCRVSGRGVTEEEGLRCENQGAGI
jgi:hypothetical protein